MNTIVAVFMIWRTHTFFYWCFITRQWTSVKYLQSFFYWAYWSQRPYRMKNSEISPTSDLPSVQCTWAKNLYFNFKPVYEFLHPCSCPFCYVLVRNVTLQWMLSERKFWHWLTQTRTSYTRGRTTMPLSYAIWSYRDNTWTIVLSTCDRYAKVESNRPTRVSSRKSWPLPLLAPTCLWYVSCMHARQSHTLIRCLKMKTHPTPPPRFWTRVIKTHLCFSFSWGDIPNNKSNA